MSLPAALIALAIFIAGIAAFVLGAIRLSRTADDNADVAWRAVDEGEG